MWLAVLGSIATAATAAIAAFELSLPDRSRAWALLPLPAAALWVGASGLGCMRAFVLPGTHVAAIGETRDCLLFIIGLSVPLSAALILMLRRAYSEERIRKFLGGNLLRVFREITEKRR